MTLNELQRIKQWHVAHKADHPLEYHLWDLVLTLWVLLSVIAFALKNKRGTTPRKIACSF